MHPYSRIGWRAPLAIGIPALSVTVGAVYLRFAVLRTLRDDRGYERNLRRWTPIATEFRARQIRLARLLIRSAHTAERAGLLSSPRQRAIETNALRLVRFESRPVYASGRHGEWGDTGVRWRQRDQT